MSTYLIAIVTLIYGVGALNSLARGDLGMALVLSGYTLANVGLIVLGGQT